MLVCVASQPRNLSLTQQHLLQWRARTALLAQGHHEGSGLEYVHARLQRCPKPPDIPYPSWPTKLNSEMSMKAKAGNTSQQWGWAKPGLWCLFPRGAEEGQILTQLAGRGAGGKGILGWLSHWALFAPSALEVQGISNFPVLQQMSPGSPAWSCCRQWPKHPCACCARDPHSSASGLHWAGSDPGKRH